ncbi:MAG: FG-GAP-like repeat-containing protein [Bacteroidales bacterium]|nr:FG-GAP-like repeat-containing protein [Bacteroidales bacterium]
MKRILMILSILAAASVSLRAQIAVSPSSLTWDYDESDMRTVQVSCAGRWETDSTVSDQHFTQSAYNGTGPVQLEISPSGRNTSDFTIVETIVFSDGAGNTATLTLHHKSLTDMLAVSPSSLGWTASDTSSRVLTITAPGLWSATVRGAGFSLNGSSGSGNASIRVHPVRCNAGPNALEAVLEISGNGLVSRTVSLSQAGDPGAQPALGTDTVPDGDPGMEIPFERTISPTGAVSYTIPVMTDPLSKYAPSLALVYDSQSGNGTAGFGWNVAGLPAITQIPETQHYHGRQAAALVSSQERHYALDGVPIVESSFYASGVTAYPYETVRGHIRVRETTGGFEALYPDGSRALFGTCAPGQDAFYPVTLLEDRFGHRIEVTYLHDGGCYYPLTVTYNQTGASQGLITLSYADRTDAVEGFYAGIPVCRRKILTRIVSSVGGDELRTYDLLHGSRSGAAVLTAIHCSLGESRIAPLRFEYGGDDAIPAESIDTKGLAIVTGGVQPGSGGNTLLRGKFSVLYYDDGAVTVPQYPNYVLNENSPDESGGYHFAQCGSGFPAGARIYLTPVILPGEDTLALTAGENFQDIQVADTDGNGVDEIVKVGYNESRFGIGKTALEIGVYKYNETTRCIEQTVSHTAAIEGAVRERYDGINHYSLPQRLYRYGCFMQDTTTLQLLAVSYSTDMLGRTMPANTALIDVTSGDVLYDNVLLDIPYGQDYRLIVADMDSDGISEICLADWGGLKVYGYRNGILSLVRNCGGITAQDLAGGYSVADVNGDGYTDLVCRRPDSSVWTAFLFDGTSFSKRMWDAGEVSGDGSLVMMDVNRDGLPDAVCVDAGTGRVSYCINEGGSFAAGLKDSGLSLQPGYAPFPVNMTECAIASTLAVEKDGVLQRLSFSRNARKDLLMTGAKDSRLNVCRYTYGDVSEVGGAYDYNPWDLEMGPWYTERSFPLPVVSRARTLSGGKAVEHRTFRYRDAVVATDGAGFICFAGTTETDSLRGRQTVTSYDPAVLGAPFRICGYSAGTGDSPVSEVKNGFNPVLNRYGKPVDARLLSQYSVDSVKHVTTDTGYGYDYFGFATSSSTTRTGGTGRAAFDSASFYYAHSLTDGMYVLGAVGEEQRFSDLDGNRAAMLGSRTRTDFDALMRPVRTRRYDGSLSGGSAAWSPASDRTVTYDAFGNVNAERTASYGATTYNVTSYSYGTDGRHLLSSTDALGRTTAFSGYDRYGNPAQATDHLGHNTLYAYDAWGRLTRTTKPDGTVETVASSWSTGAEPGLLCVTQIATGKPDAKTWTDALGREVRSAARRFDGAWQYVNSEYDAWGRLLRTSLPYRDAAAGPSLWDTYTYDGYDRPIALEEAGGKLTLWSYDATSTTVIRDDIATTTVTDAAGNVVLVTDPGGTVAYSLRDDAQPSAVTVTPAGSGQGVVTGFSYDANGRRTLMTDPSAGVRTTAYTDNADGTSSVAATGPAGTVTTAFDRFGRVTAVSRPEFSTAYTYGTTPGTGGYGELLAEASTNGTGRTFTYDSFGRVLTETEHAADTLWLRKAYTYGAGSNVAAIAYATRDGGITTETFSYAYGHNTAVSIPEGAGTTVWSLTAENALGQPAAITTGSVSRTYSYTAAGIPQRRLARSVANATIQDLSYGYDEDGRMLWRQDDVSGYREAFSYDGLDRLTASRQTFTGSVTRPELDYGHADTGFSANGNVLSRDNDGILDCLLEYSSTSDPYRTTGSHSGGGAPAYVPTYGSVTMTSFDRPAGIAAPGGSASTIFTYDASGSRVRMTRDEDDFGIRLDRWYLGGVYERDVPPGSGTPAAERLFLGGTAYDAPMVLVKAPSVNGGAWTPFNILRDVQGSITEVTSANGSVVVESFRYDPWGLRTLMYIVDSLVVDPGPEGYLPPADSAAIFLEGWQRMGQSIYVGGHGYTGHEHLPGWGLINMNARLYDPALCRFLSPDPLIQDPLSTQNFNRYSYCLNNPLKYTDPTGEIAWFVPVVVAAVLGGVSGYMIGKTADASGWKMAGYIAGGALIGGLSAGAAVGVSALGGGAMLSAASAGAIGGAGFSGLSTKWNGGAMFKGAAIGAISGLVGGGTAAAIGGGLGAFAGGAVGSGISAAFHGSNPQESIASMLMGGALSYGSYELMSFFSFKQANLSINDYQVTYKQFKTMQADFQRSRFWHKEFGGLLTKNGNVIRAPADHRHSIAVKFSRTMVLAAEEDGGIVSSYHTHWAKANVEFYVNNSYDIVDLENAYWKITTSNGASLEDKSTVAGLFGGNQILIDRNYLYFYNTTDSLCSSATIMRFFPIYYWILQNRVL